MAAQGGEKKVEEKKEEPKKEEPKKEEVKKPEEKEKEDKGADYELIKAKKKAEAAGAGPKAAETAAGAGKYGVGNRYVPESPINRLCQFCAAPGPFVARNAGCFLCPSAVLVCFLCGRPQAPTVYEPQGPDLS